MEHNQAVQIHQYFQQIYVLLDDGDRRALRAAGLTPTQFQLLRRLSGNPEHALTITQISVLLLCTRSNATRLVRRMQQQALVQCAPDPRDLRLVKVSLTPEGEARLAQADTIYTAAIERRLGAVPSAAQTALHQTLAQIAEMLAADLVAQPAIFADDGDDAEL